MLSNARVRLVAIGLIVMVALTGCQQPARKPRTVTPPATLEMSEFRQLADKLSNQAVKVEGVENATVILQGQGKRINAIVGLMVKKGQGNKEEKKVMDEVANRLTQADPRIKRVQVTADPDLVAKIRAIAKKVADGKPVSQLQGDINEVSRRIPPR
ncbi:MAG TPA: YhcN/YlaJ family sporulation lipoprotein [Syntrophothermus lipocalidus]|uniref:Sporulation lipoprotein YhcN/YlaJ n=1 Tax=Syntrophothermus lipocalidus (strain DSM 12680 / TGB-C1) TaxID=643648 RepID=D7CIJ9_SYNLT|nr:MULTISPECIES: YhcN/YlaJ family sporulation lipoprotein [Syntrophothermus]ADI00864.1 Sporulation lipoprotein YhcN/YlaJ [Syntrophothermus lipocalidus DSM 12680]NSW83366.1 YhcN/YlaJ family sporulation lipoprotein [Syntrophothermus sp.]HHV76934.1 YhcN/YlaJ family sporulation lipoprotein [Syntrophothermus lipocalidus]HOV43618.1 YhcN/YlaJ family sporulation lipoprotein [Syntrophothermus lipocalidus]